MSKRIAYKSVLANLLASLENGNALAAQATHAQNPAATAPLPGWVADAVASAPVAVQTQTQTHAQPKQPAYLTRSWVIEGSGMSKSGNPTVTFRTTTSNGLAFRCTVPADLVKYIGDLKAK